MQQAQIVIDHLQPCVTANPKALGWFTKKNPQSQNTVFSLHFLKSTWDLWGACLGDQSTWKINTTGVNWENSFGFPSGMRRFKSQIDVIFGKI